ncbi:transglutaminase-like domain-containing protein [Derxia lacustris]|uniref:transglutaminase-like domain-containing protein n=1 Tax=Derxia lacustris TaxID=764842 RepID=UPI000A173D8C|nr:transglutaminase family protein [Derxia lacustris]
MVNLRYTVDLDYDVLAPGADFILGIHAARTPRQRLSDESLVISQPVSPRVHEHPLTRTRVMQLHADAGQLSIRYAATVAIAHHVESPERLSEVPIDALPANVLTYLYPSRYCESDVLHQLGVQEFGTLPRGYGRVAAIRDWVTKRVTFRSASSLSTTTACDTARTRVGVCRDFAHLMIALCRAVNIPARFATGLDYGADPVLGPPDFHAYVEVYLSHRWYLFDPSGTAMPMGFVRIATGRDAADAAFATIFGAIRSGPPVVRIRAVAGDDGDAIVPLPSDRALSTDDGGGLAFAQA